MPCGATQDWRVMVERSDRMWSTGEGNGKPLQYSCLENPITVWEGRMIGYWKRNSPGQEVPNMLLEISGERTPERMKGWSQSKHSTQLWMWLVIEARSNALKSSIAQEPGMLGPWIKANWKWSNSRWQEWTLTFQESANWNGLEWVILTQMTIISTTVDKNPSEEME